jgi:hypothetical protein
MVYRYLVSGENMKSYLMVLAVVAASMVGSSVANAQPRPIVVVRPVVVRPVVVYPVVVRPLVAYPVVPQFGYSRYQHDYRYEYSNYGYDNYGYRSFNRYGSFGWGW